MNIWDVNRVSDGSETRFRSAFEHAAIGVGVVDAAGEFTYVNAAFCRITGYDHNELLGMRYTLTLHPDDRTASWAIFEHMIAGQVDSSTRERRLHRKDGSIVWVSTSISVAAEEPGPPQILALIEDISARKQAEDALSTSEERFRIAAENASDTIYEWDLASGHVNIYGRISDRLGDRPMPRHVDDWKTLVHPDDVDRVLAEMEKCIASGKPYSGEYRVIGATGHIFHYSNRGQAIRNSSGQPYKWIGLVTDITQSKKAEEAISQLAAIVQCSQDAIIGLNHSGVITTWNNGAERLLGYPAGKAIGQPFVILLPNSDVTADVLNAIGRLDVGRFEETSLLRNDATEVPVALTISPIRKASGEVTGLAAIAHDISERKQAEVQLEHQARHDDLTGLPNRAPLEDCLATAIAHSKQNGSMAGVIYVDLDGFKVVNDTLGHESGDLLLQQVAKRLSACIRPSDTLARMGGDEFMLVAANLPDAGTVASISKRLALALKEPFQVANHELYVSASIGISMYPADGEDVSTLRRNADAAMYEAKRAGKDRIRFFTAAVGAAVIERLEIESELRRALDLGQLLLHYQPIFAVNSHRITAFEALVRWAHPAQGLIPPSKFIPVAEETGLIVRLGAWVLKEACMKCAAWQKEDILVGARVSVNISPLQFARPDFVRNVLATLDQSGLPAGLLDLELTETMLMRDLEASMRKMSHLRDLGIKISIDDFGTGYSSLSYLARLPMHTLKIDRSFVTEITRNAQAASLLEGMIRLVQSIGKHVVVEGVETREQFAILEQAGCEEVQGYLLGRPTTLPLDDSSRLIEISQSVWRTGLQDLNVMV